MRSDHANLLIKLLLMITWISIKIKTFLFVLLFYMIEWSNCVKSSPFSVILNKLNETNQCHTFVAWCFVIKLMEIIKTSKWQTSHLFVISNKYPSQIKGRTGTLLLSLMHENWRHFWFSNFLLDKNECWYFF